VSNCNHAFLVPICLTSLPEVSPQRPGVIGVSVSGPQVPGTSGSGGVSVSGPQYPGASGSGGVLGSGSQYPGTSGSIGGLPIPPVQIPAVTSAPSTIVGGNAPLQSGEADGTPSGGNFPNIGGAGLTQGQLPGTEDQSAAVSPSLPPVDQPITDLNLPSDIQQAITPPSLIASSAASTTMSPMSSSTTSSTTTLAPGGGGGGAFSLSPGSIYPCERPGYYMEPANCRQFYTCKEVAPGEGISVIFNNVSFYNVIFNTCHF